MRFTVVALLILTSALMPGCTGPLFKDQALDSAFTSGQLRVGCTMDDAIRVVGRPPNTFADIFRESHTASGTRVVWAPGARGENFSHTYVLTFENGRLIEYSR